MATSRNELRTDLRITGENAVKAGLRGVGDAAEDAGDDFREMGHDAGFLERKLIELKAAQLALLHQLNDTGDVALLKDIRKARREIREFERLSRELTPEFAAAGTKAGTAFAGSLQGPVIAGVAAIAAVAAPFLGASLGAAIVGGVGIGGIVGGIAAASRDPRVKAEAEKVGAAFSEAFGKLGEPFIDPVIEALKSLKASGVDVLGALKGPLGSLAPEVQPLARALAQLVKEALPGFTAAIAASKPLLDALADEMPEIGKALSEFFAAISSNPEAATAALKVLLQVLEDAIKLSGGFIAAMEDIFEGMVRFVAKIQPALEAAFGWIPGVGDRIRENGERVRELVEEMDAAEEKGRELKKLYEQFPALVQTQVELTGVKPTLEQLQAIIALLNVVRGGISGALGGARIGARASGGPVSAGGTYLVGEHGPEVLQMGANGGYVSNTSQTAAMMSGPARPVVNISFQPTGDALADAVLNAIWPMVLRRVRVDGGDLAAFGAA